MIVYSLIYNLLTVMVDIYSYTSLTLSVWKYMTNIITTLKLNHVDKSFYCHK